jgi:Ca2+-binding EF-hand superfamily protein
MMMKTLLLPTFGLVLAAGAALAQDGPQADLGATFGPGPDFATLDANADGLLSEDELTAAGQARFASADTDGNGGLSAAELLAAIEAARAAALQARVEARVTDVDDDGDGLLQLEEIAERLPSADMVIERLDADADGQISAEEFAARMDDRRDRRDGHRPFGGWFGFGGDRHNG